MSRPSPAARLPSRDERAHQASRLLIQDTDLLSSVLYSRHYYGDCPHWIEVAFEKRPADLYLLADIDIPWVPDGGQRDRGHRREEMHELFPQRPGRSQSELCRDPWFTRRAIGGSGVGDRAAQSRASLEIEKSPLNRCQSRLSPFYFKWLMM